jgi:lipoate-protein ligase A
MACDEALLRSLQPDDAPILRLYRWTRPTLTFGYFLKHADAQAAAGPDEEIVRRWTGGGMVHHGDGRDFTWSILVPRAHPFAQVRPMESYGQLHQAAAAALTEAGISGAIVVPADSPAPRGGLCFQAPAPGDLLLHGQKIAGAGQRRTRHGLLHQASLRLPGSTGDGPADLMENLASQLCSCPQPFPCPDGLEIPQATYASEEWRLRV